MLGKTFINGAAAMIIMATIIISGEGQLGDEEMILPDQSEDQGITSSHPIEQTDEGNEFFVGFFRNIFGRYTEFETIPPVLWITTNELAPVNFNVSTVTGLLEKNVAVPGQITYIHIPVGYIVFDSTKNPEFKAIHIKAENNRKIVVFGQNEQSASNDAYLALPVTSSSHYEYIVASLLAFRSNIQEPKNSVALIIGTENDTEIILEPSLIINHPFAINDSFIPGNAIEFRSVTIQKFQTFYLQVLGDLSGTRIIANKPISVFSGHECAYVPVASRSCDMLIEQLQPIDTWGTEVAIIPLRTRVGLDIIKIFAAHDSTIISLTGTNVISGTVTSEIRFTLDANKFREMLIRDFTLIQSNYQIAVFQFSRSSRTDFGPFMLSVPPREQYRDSYVVAPAPFDPSLENLSRGRVAYVNYTSIAVPAEYFNSSLITINNSTINASEFRPIRRADNSTWGYGARLLLDEGVQVIKHEDSNAALSVIMYGFSNQMSWGCAGGTGLVTIPFLRSVDVIAIDPQEVGQLLIIDCSSDTFNVQSTKNQKVGQSLILRCAVNTVRPNNASVNLTWTSNNKTLRMMDQIGLVQDHYIISQLNTSNDGQSFECTVIINTTPPVFGSGTIVLNLTVTTFTVTASSFTSMQEVMVGDSQDIQCTVEVEFNGVEPNSVMFNWLGPEGNLIMNTSRVIVSSTNFSANTFVSTLQFSYLMAKDNGIYTCNVMILKTTQSDSIEMGRPNVPTPNVSIIAYDDMIVGQPFSLECIITTVRGISNQVNIIWSKGSNGKELKRENVSSYITVNSSVMYRDYFNIPKLTTDDNSETYRCEIIIHTSSPVMASDSYTLYVTVPSFSIATTPTGLIQGALVGDNLIIHCTISTVSGVKLNAVTVDWIGPGGTSIKTENIMTSRPTISSSNNFTNSFSCSLEFIYLREVNEGRYMCNVSILQASASTTVELDTLIVPTPTVSVAVMTNQTAGEPLTLYCNVTTVKGITSAVDIMWLVDGSQLEIADPDVSLTSDNLRLYLASYTIDQPSESDNERVYQCKVRISSDLLVMASDNFTLNITGLHFDENISASSWMIVGISAGVTLVIAAITTLLCLVLLRKKRPRKNVLSMTAVDLNLHPRNNSYSTSFRSTTGTFEPISIEQWKKELAGYLIEYSCLDIKGSIASGKFGVVYKALYASKENSTAIEVAVKTVKHFSSNAAEDFIKECNVANKFDHPNVLSLIGVCIAPEEAVPLMVMPYMHHGDVRSYVKSKRENNIKVDEFPPDLSEGMLTKICFDIAKGMEYLATKHFVHRDLAARNCMLDQTMTTKVADFGLSRDVYVTDYYTMSHATPLPVKWLAPEALFDRHFNEKTDIWAFGVTCWEVFSLGLQPYPLIGPSEIGNYIRSGKILDKPQLSSVEMYEIMKCCWKFNADERPNFSELVKEIDHSDETCKPQSKQFLKKESAAYLPLYS